MYKLFLCLRYLRTRWIALASVVSVTLGVATLIVVNSVMGGFATEMRDRVKGLLADIMVEGLGLTGFADAEQHVQHIREALGDKIEAMTVVVETPGFLILTIRGEEFVELVHVVGIDMESYGHVCKFLQYLHEKELRENPSFEVGAWLNRDDELWRKWEPDDDEFDAITPSVAASTRSGARNSVTLGEPQGPDDPDDPDPSVAPSSEAGSPLDNARHAMNPFQQRSGSTSDRRKQDSLLGPLPDATEKDRGIIIPYLLATTRWHQHDVDLVRPGDQVRLALPRTSITRVKIEAAQSQFTTVGRFKSGMSEYDQSNCYVDIKDLQELRGMPDRVNAIYIKLRNYSDAKEVSERLRSMFPVPHFQIRTWEQKQGQLLAAVATEQAILNVLLFMIIAVAGFGILAIFYMIVVEKMRDIGVLKSLGASDRGVMGIFLGYGLGLGVVGSGLGMTIGLLIVVYLDKIEKWLSWATGHEVFSRDLYYFDKIPAVINEFNIAWIVVSAMLIALAASVLPAWRAARLRPVQSLRYE